MRTRFVIASRRAGKIRETEKGAARQAVTAVLGGLRHVTVLEERTSSDPLARRIVIVGADAIVEPEILHYPLVVPPRDLAIRRAPAAVTASAAGRTTELRTRVRAPRSRRPPSSCSVGLGARAPGCHLLVARVFPGPDSGASNADIANAIDELAENRAADLINMSLGASVPSEVVRDAIIGAAERGTLCVCAAGNESGPINFPAAFPEAVAVAALGLAGWAPPGTLSASRLPEDPAQFGEANLFLANFSCRGREMGAAGAGVGIIAPVPAHDGDAAPYAAMDGTSMASPAVCGALAALLGDDAGYRALPRGLARSGAARQILNANLRDIGLATEYQGRGMPWSAGRTS